VLTTIGIWLIVVSVVAVVFEGMLAVVWGVALARRSVALSKQLETERGMIEADLARLRVAIEETKRLWRPYQRVLRWVRHPLVIALLESFARRRVRAR
jgi:hypothetical protein